MEKLKIAIIGIGHLGTRHLKVCDELRDLITIEGICDIKKERTLKLASHYKVPYFEDYRDLADKVEAVLICVPTESHFEIAKFFLENEIHVFIEKPITSTVAEADELIKLAAAKNRKLQVGHVERFNSAFQSIKHFTNEPLFIECHRLNKFPNRSLDIGVVMDLMIHDIDIILGLIKSPIKEIQPVGVNVLTALEDIASVRITFENGCVCNLTASRVSDDVMRKIRIFQKETYISLDYVKQEAFIYKKKENNILKHSLPIEKEEPLKKEVEHFFQCIVNDTTPLISGTEGRDALKVAITIGDKIWKEKPVKTSPPIKHLMFVAGEASGDMHAAHLIDEIKKIDPSITFSGLGGKEMQRTGVEVFHDLTKMAVIGVSEVIRHYDTFKQIFDMILAKILERRPDAVVLVDYPGFNLRLAKELKKHDIKVIYYISPQVWAWKKNRIYDIEKYVDRMLVLFEFEKDFYAKHGVDVTFVGHPLVDMVKTTNSRSDIHKKLKLDTKKRTIGILPGSRLKEIEKNLPSMIEAVHLLNEKFADLQFILVKADTIKDNQLEQYLFNKPGNLEIITENNYNGINACDFCMVASGTATLETALLEKPMVIIYKTTWLTYILARIFVKISHIGLVNIVAGKEIAPECIQHEANGENIANKLAAIINDEKRIASIKNDLRQIRVALGSNGASLKAAKKVLQIINP